MSAAGSAPEPACLVFPPGHPVFAGHFPQHPIVPGALLLDAALLAIADAAPDADADAPDDAAADAVAQHVANVKFFRPVGPGEVLSLSFQCLPDGCIPFEWRCGEERIASGTLMRAGAQRQRLK
jgi:3-hydroxymyristoyl/3-hydroxydecanoyl-(acyl carrier protein) dehydratase